MAELFKEGDILHFVPANYTGGFDGTKDWAGRVYDARLAESGYYRVELMVSGWSGRWNTAIDQSNERLHPEYPHWIKP